MIIEGNRPGVDTARRRKYPERQRGQMSEKKDMMSEMLSSLGELEHYLEVALDSLLEITGVDTGWLQLLAPGGAPPLAYACRGCSEEMRREAQALAQREAGRPPEAGAIIVPDLSRAADPGLAAFSAAGYASLIAVPLSTNLFNGFLGFVSRKPAAFNGETAEVLKPKAGLIAAALEKGALSLGLADVLAKQAQPGRHRVRELKRLATIAGGHYREVRQAMKRAIGHTRRIDKKYIRATQDLSRETARWEDLLRKARAEFSHPALAGEPETAPPGTEPTEGTPAKPPPALDFADHADRMAAFRRSHADYK
jgi:hypothetical protein